MLPSRYDPFAGFGSIFSLRRDIDRLFRDFMEDVSSSQLESGEIAAAIPKLDLVEKGDAYTLHADMPGVDPKDVKVQVTGNRLTIEGEKREERSEEGERRVRERVFRRYERSITLPDVVDASKIQANLKNGVLTLTLPKSEQSRPRQIEVKGEGGAKQIEATKQKKEAA